jgi:hypothetical protein
MIEDNRLMKITKSYLAPLLLLLVGAFSTGCSTSPQETAPAPRVENSGLGIALATVPSPFVVGTNEGSTLKLRAPGETSEGILFFEVAGETRGGINLIAEAEGMQDWFEQQPDGQFFGNLELGTPLGPAFTSRGSYTLDGVMIEELRVFAIHPSSNRLLRMTYRYSPGEGKERLQQLAEVLGEVEAFDTSVQAGDSATPEN